MTELERREESTDTRQLILGFDAGCGTCSDLAGSIQKRVGEKLAVRNLNDPELLGWREQALGKDARWAPTLFEVNGSEVRAWAGWKMGFALSRAIGPAATWQVMQALGEVGAAPRIEESVVVEKLPEKAAEAVVGMSRGQFLKGVGGAAVAMSLLSGGMFTPLAHASKTSPYDIVEITPINGNKLNKLAKRRARNRDVRNVAGSALSNTEKVDKVKKHGGKKRLRNGTSVTTVVYVISKRRLITHSQYSKPIKGMSTSIAQVIVTELKSRKRVDSTVVKASSGGRLWRRSGTTRAAQKGIQPLAECPPESGGSTTDPPLSNCRSYLKKFCLKWEDDFSCWAGKGGRLTVSCVGCAVGVVTAPTPAGLVRQVVGGASLAQACDYCTNTHPKRKFEGCSKCVATDVNRVYDCS